MKKILTFLLAVLALTVLVCAVSAAPASLKDEISAAQSGDTVVLQENAGAVTVDKDLTLDLNGFDVAGITATGGVTVLVKDSKTDDYTVSDGDYGTVAATSGDVQPAEGYLAVPNGGVSYHKVIFKAASVVLRAENAGMYYTCEFAGDEVVREYIDGFGVALELNAAPNAETIAKDTAGKKRAEYDREAWTTGAVSQANGVLVKGIMKEENGYAMNKRNATVPVYGAAYLRAGNTYYLSNGVSLTMQAAVEYADTRWISLEDVQKNALLGLLDTYKSVLNTWATDNLEAAALEIYQNRSFKVLTLGHSLAVDAGNMLAYVAANEGYADITIGTLYYSGCTLQQHANFIKTGDAYKWFYVSSTANPKVQPKGYSGYTMYDALTYTDWDVIIMQNGVFHSGLDNYYQPYQQTVIDFVTQTMNDPNNPNANPDFIFGWNIIWPSPEDADLMATSRLPSADFPNGPSATYEDNFTRLFKHDSEFNYEEMVRMTQKYVLQNPVYDFIIPSGTALMNARSSYLTEQDLYRDYIHMNDYGRLMASYVWYYSLTGKEFKGISVDRIPAALRYYSADRSQDLVLTKSQIAILEESVANALKNPLTVTQSQYTTAP